MGYSCYLSYYIITEKPSAWQLYSESYERTMADEESYRIKVRQKRRRKVAIIVGLVLGALALVLCLIGLSIRYMLS
jgi:type VI protein secretion system component VasF